MIATTPQGLLVDDSRRQLHACQKLLAAWGIHTDAAATMGEATTKAELGEYRFALLDYSMPDAPDGPRALIQLLRSRIPACQIFIVTAYPDEARGTLGDLRLPVLQKPLDWDAFKNTLTLFQS